MKHLIFIFILIAILTGCTTRQEPIDFQQVLEVAQTRADQAKSLSEDTLLTQALAYYQTLEPKDSARLSQATILTAYHYWWKGEKAKAYNLLERRKGQSLQPVGIHSRHKQNCFRILTRFIQQRLQLRSLL